MKTINICKNCWKLYYDILHGYVCDRCNIHICINCINKHNDSILCNYCFREVEK